MSTTSTDVYAEAEAKVEAARDNLTRRQREAGEAEGAPYRLRATIRSGKGDHLTAADLAAAEYAEEYAELRLQAAKVAMQRAEQVGPFRPRIAPTCGIHRHRARHLP